MRDVCCRTYFCPKLGETVTLVRHTRNDCGHAPVCGILSCSHQDECALREAREGREELTPWAECPACKEMTGE